jgi:cobalamin biosynthesis Mg chelatase CobN
MQGAPRRSARPFFVLPLALALLAFVAVPALAQAGENGPAQYEPEPTESFKVPNSTKESTSKSKGSTHESSGKSSKESKANGNPAASASEAGGTGKKSSSEEEPEEGSEKEAKTGGAATGNGGNKPGGGEGAKANKGGGAESGVGGQQEVTGGNIGTPVAHKTSSSGGSSPVVPILIAVAVLAAISIGVVLYRQRKSGGQGPDRRVSSPNAS